MRITSKTLKSIILEEYNKLLHEQVYPGPGVSPGWPQPQQPGSDPRRAPPEAPQEDQQWPEQPVQPPWDPAEDEGDGRVPQGPPKGYEPPFRPPEPIIMDQGGGGVPGIHYPEHADSPLDSPERPLYTPGTFPGRDLPAAPGMPRPEEQGWNPLAPVAPRAPVTYPDRGFFPPDDAVDEPGRGWGPARPGDVGPPVNLPVRRDDPAPEVQLYENINRITKEELEAMLGKGKRKKRAKRRKRRR